MDRWGGVNFEMGDLPFWLAILGEEIWGVTYWKLGVITYIIPAFFKGPFSYGKVEELLVKTVLCLKDHVFSSKKSLARFFPPKNTNGKAASIKPIPHE